MVSPDNVFRPRDVTRNQPRFAHEVLLYQAQIMEGGLSQSIARFQYTRELRRSLPGKTSPRNTQKDIARPIVEFTMTELVINEPVNSLPLLLIRDDHIDTKVAVQSIGQKGFFHRESGA